jgi:hypothetical protein
MKRAYISIFRLKLPKGLEYQVNVWSDGEVWNVYVIPLNDIIFHNLKKIKIYNFLNDGVRAPSPQTHPG